MKKKLLKKKIVAGAMAVAFTLSFSVSSFADILSGFEQSNYYNDDIYYDVGTDDWFYNYVGFAYEYGIMSGTATNFFEPSGNITVAEAITVASRLNAEYYGNTINTNTIGATTYSTNFTYGNNISVLDENTEYAYPINGDVEFEIIDNSDNISHSPKTKRYIKTEGVGARTTSSALSWFMPYLNYAVEQGIVGSGDFANQYLNPATKSQIAYILYSALPECYEQINNISPIPDVNSSNPYYSPILKMYESGVLTGDDEYGTFYPNNNVLRCEVATMVSRIINTDLRSSFELNQNKPYSTLSYSWSYPYGGSVYSINADISYNDYNYFASKPRTYDYAAYGQDKADETVIYAMADAIKNIATENGYTSAYDLVSFMAAFVQGLEYQEDMAYKGAREYPKYPLETLYDQGGDCEDTSVLLAKMLKMLGFGTVLLVSDNHMAVGVQTSDKGNVSYNGVEYYYVETTESGWRVGEVPDDMLGVKMEVLYI